MNIEELKELAEARVKSYTKVAKELENEFIPLKIASKWLTAINRNILDLDEISQILREAKFNQYSADIGFFALCSEIESVYKELWQESLNKS